MSKTFYQLADELHAELVKYYGSEAMLVAEFYTTAVNDAVRAMNELTATIEDLVRRIENGEIVIVDGRLSRFVRWIKRN